MSWSGPSVSTTADLGQLLEDEVVLVAVEQKGGEHDVLPLDNLCVCVMAFYTMSLLFFCFGGWRRSLCAAPGPCSPLGSLPAGREGRGGVM